MGFLDDDDSTSCGSDTLNDMSCSNMSISVSRRSSTFGGRRRSSAGHGAGGGSKSNFKFSWDDSGLSLTNKRHNASSSKNSSTTSGGFKFSWDDSGMLSVDTQDLEESDSSFLQMGNYSRQRKSQTATPLGKVLEQVDGVKYKEDDKRGQLGSSSLLAPFQDDEDDDDDALLFLPPKPAAAPAPAPPPAPAPKAPEPKPEPAPEPERQTIAKFADTVVTAQIDFVQDEDAVLAVWDDDHVAEPHNEIPWDEQDYEELPWHLQPDLDEDDEITKRVKVILGLGQEEEEKGEDEEGDEEGFNDEETAPPLEEEDQRHVDRVEALVISFCLLLKYKRLDSINNSNNKAKILDGDDSSTLDTSATTSRASIDSL